MTTLTERGTHRELREHVAALHACWCATSWSPGPRATSRERVPGEDLFVIKGSGVSYDELTWEGITVCDLDGKVVDGVRAPVERHRRARLRLPAPGPRCTGRCTRTARTPRPGRPAARRCPAC